MEKESLWLVEASSSTPLMISANKISGLPKKSMSRFLEMTSTLSLKVLRTLSLALFWSRDQMTIRLPRPKKLSEMDSELSRTLLKMDVSSQELEPLKSQLVKDLCNSLKRKFLEKSNWEYTATLKLFSSFPGLLLKTQVLMPKILYWKCKKLIKKKTKLTALTLSQVILFHPKSPTYGTTTSWSVSSWTSPLYSLSSYFW